MTDMNEENYKKNWDDASHENQEINAETDARLKEGISRKIKTVRTYRSLYWAAAASVIIGLGIAFFPTAASSNLNDDISIVHYYSSSNYKKEVTLPDGSLVSLEPHSTLLVADDFGESDRKITFTGKGTFDIAKNKKKPFRINAKDFTIQVLGTKFFLDQTAGKQKVELFEGKVKINDGGKITYLLPQEIWTQTIEAAVEKEFEIINYKRNFLFQDDTFKNIIVKLEKEYQIKIDYPEEYRNKKMKGSVNGNLNEVLSTLCYPFNLKVLKISENKIELK
jgi:transmembrane sensor